jgi:outer membrane protein assembly factor BamB
VISKRNKKVFIGIFILISVLLILAVLLTGCVRGMTAVGWSGVTIDDNGMAYTGSKQGQLVAVNLNNNSLAGNSSPLKAASSGGAGCSTSSGSSGSACGGAAASVAIYGSPVLVNNIPVGVDDKGNAILGTISIVAGYNGKVFAFQSNNLKNEVWEFPKGASNLAPIVSAVIASGNILYFGCSDGNLYAIDAALGNEKWHFTTQGEIWATPSINNNIVFISSFDKNIYAVDATTGSEKWRFPTGSTNVAASLTLNGMVYVGSLDQNLYALNETTGQMVWKFTGGSWFWAKPVAVNGVIYAPNQDHNVYALDAKTGNLVATYDVGGQVSSWPTVVNNQVIVATQNGKLWSLDSVNPSSGPKEIIAIPQNVTSPLSAVDDIVYFNGPESDNNIYGINITKQVQATKISLTTSQ